MITTEVQIGAFFQYSSDVKAMEANHSLFFQVHYRHSAYTPSAEIHLELFFRALKKTNRRIYSFGKPDGQSGAEEMRSDTRVDEFP